MGKKKKLPTAKQARQAAYALHSLIIRDTKPFCQGKFHLPGDCNGVLQCAHIISKEQAGRISTRIDNGVTLCAKHHQQIDNNRVRWFQLVVQGQLMQNVIELQRVQDESMVSSNSRSAAWWREEAARLHGECVARSIEVRGVTKLMLDWIATSSAAA